MWRYEVSSRVNAVKNDDPACEEPVSRLGSAGVDPRVLNTPRAGEGLMGKETGTVQFGSAQLLEGAVPWSDCRVCGKAPGVNAVA